MEKFKNFCKRNKQEVFVVSVTGTILAAYLLGLYLGVNLTKIVRADVLRNSETGEMFTLLTDVSGGTYKIPFEFAPEAKEIFEAAMADLAGK